MSFFDSVVLQRVRDDARLAAFLPRPSRPSGNASGSGARAHNALGALGEYANLAEVANVLLRVVRGRPDLVHRVLPAGGLVSVLFHFSATFQQTKVAVDRLQRKSKSTVWTVADGACARACSERAHHDACVRCSGGTCNTRAVRRAPTPLASTHVSPALPTAPALLPYVVPLLVAAYTRRRAHLLFGTPASPWHAV